jgi:hypothetical protein
MTTSRRMVSDTYCATSYPSSAAHRRRTSLPSKAADLEACLQRLPPGSSRGLSVLAAIFHDLLFALVKPLHYRRSPWYQHGFICEALPKVSVILLHDVEDRFLGEFSMVPGK